MKIAVLCRGVGLNRTVFVCATAPCAWCRSHAAIDRVISGHRSPNIQKDSPKRAILGTMGFAGEGEKGEKGEKGAGKGYGKGYWGGLLRVL